MLEGEAASEVVLPLSDSSWIRVIGVRLTVVVELQRSRTQSDARAGVVF